ncbi:uncharacterized protein LOC117767875 [Hippoglossus hippoglossus]|uniref:uncharacterized protein LOC117767875 n=1 Tax=Hippoglossus hippoglossus TaxID=8267 RepID=UPI00148BB76B|nr:uncharacterized protein LOC117767875 [Hippoglossus hippoglossus]
MPGMTVTFLLITFLPSPFCQLLFSFLTNSPCALLWCSVTMSIQRVLLTLPLCFCMFSSSLAPHPSSAEKSGCFKVNNCKCIMKDGSGVINLNSMGDPDGFLGYLKPVSAEDIPVNTEILLSFSPCQPFSQPEDLTGADCTNIAACLIVRYQRLNTYISRCIGYGRHEGNEFHYNDTLKMLSVSYFAVEKQPLTVVHYHCNPNQSTSFIRDQRLSSEEPLHIWVESPCACPNACTMGDLGSGTIFLIILSLSAAAYFILGSCALRPFRGSSGVQISPEHSVWCMICYLCTERSSETRHYTDATRCER